MPFTDIYKNFQKQFLKKQELQIQIQGSGNLSEEKLGDGLERNSQDMQC